ncbi:EcsC family protein [Alloscardovia omnicolens]|uniref:EcsC family protein n=1 Tax=Alloscardovia omnicolens TaxID=419015 RepID=UPI003A70ED6E
MDDDNKQNDTSQCEDFDKNILDSRELKEIDWLTNKYKDLTAPTFIDNAAKAIAPMVPKPVKNALGNAGNTIQQQEFYVEAMKIIAKGFSAIEAQATKVTMSEKEILRKANLYHQGEELKSLDELCFARSYELSRIVNDQNTVNLAAAFTQGGGTGLLGFAGLVPNIVLSTFCYQRAVQSIAMCYGYDVKNDPDELVIAGEIFSSALSPSSANAEGIATVVGKIMMVAEAEIVKQTAKKGWGAMAAKNSITLLLTQMRALANKSAKKALEKAGRQGLENSIFRSILEKMGGKLTQKGIQRAIPVIAAGIGAAFDTYEMQKVLDFAHTFYRKRFLLEKAERQLFILEKRNNPQN